MDGRKSGAWTLSDLHFLWPFHLSDTDIDKCPLSGDSAEMKGAGERTDFSGAFWAGTALPFDPWPLTSFALRDTFSAPVWLHGVKNISRTLLRVFYSLICLTIIPGRSLRSVGAGKLVVKGAETKHDEMVFIHDTVQPTGHQYQIWSNCSFKRLLITALFSSAFF